MLIETPLTLPAGGDRRPVAGHRDAELRAHAARTARIERALCAIEELGRRRRAQELVEAIERLGSGLGSTMTALDEVLDDVVAPDRHAPAQAWTPISTPVVPITALPVGTTPLPVPAADATAPPPVAIEAPAPVAAAAPAPSADEPAGPTKVRREAPAGLAAFVIDFSQPQG